jgi:hypothetical protein
LEFVAREHGLDTERARRFISRMKPRSIHALLASLVERLQEDRRLFCPTVDDRDRAWFDDAGQIKELIALSQRLLTGALRCPLQNRDAVANGGDHSGPSGSEFFRRKDLGSREHGLRQPRDHPCGR